MGWKQVRPFDKNQKSERSLCLKYVRLAFSPSNDDLIKGKYESAYKSWVASKTKHENKNFPTGNVYVPVWWDYTTTIDGVKENYGHVAVLECVTGKVYSNIGKNSKQNPEVFASLDAIQIAFGLGKFLGWTEDVNDVRIIEYVEDSNPVKVDLTGQMLVIIPSSLQNNKIVPLYRNAECTSAYPNGINCKDGKQRRYKIIKQIADGRYLIRVPKANPTDVYIKWIPGITFES